MIEDKLTRTNTHKHALSERVRCRISTRFWPRSWTGKYNAEIDQESGGKTKRGKMSFGLGEGNL